MYNYNLHVHFIGIGGVGMAGIAEVLLSLGYKVSGSDLKKSYLTDHLEKIGAKISIGHRPEHITSEIGVVVISSAVPPNNPELLHAREVKIPVIRRAEMLAELVRMKYGIIVAGSHGKTTTTSMIARLLSEAGLDPTVIVGGRLLSQTSGASLGSSPYLVAESDESDGSFCLLHPAIAVVTNIDREHLNYYGSFGALEAAFAQFVSAVPFYGLVVACFDDPVVAGICQKLERRVVSYGLSGTFDISARDISVDRDRSTYTLVVHGKEVGQVSLPMPGVHMVSNSLAAIAVAIELGVYPDEAANYLEHFPGVSRRSELIAEHQGIRVFDDYGHHPREIAATLNGLRQGWCKQNQGGRLVAVFQPHRYTRTRDLFSDFVTAFNDADEVIVGDIYAAGEEPIEGVSGELLASAIQHSKVSYTSELKDAVPRLRKYLQPGDVVVTLGAGSVGAIARELAAALKNES